MPSRSPSRGRPRSRSRSPARRPEYSRSRSPSYSRARSSGHSYDDSHPLARQRSPAPRRNDRDRSYSRDRSYDRDEGYGRDRSYDRDGSYGRDRSYSRGRSYSRSRSHSRDRSHSRISGRDARDRYQSPPPGRGTKVVVERLSKNVRLSHLHDIFGQHGDILDLELPMNRTSGNNRGTAYILYKHVDDADHAVAYMHEAQIDGTTIHVSIVLPRKNFSTQPQMARGASRATGPSGANQSGSGPSSFHERTGPSDSRGTGRRHPSPSSRYGQRSRTNRRSPSGPHGGAGGHYNRSAESVPQHSRSRSPGPRQRGNMDQVGYDGRRFKRSPSFGNHGNGRWQQSSSRAGRSYY